MTREEAIAYFKKNAIRIKGIMAEEDEALKDRFSETLEATEMAIKALERERITENGMSNKSIIYKAKESKEIQEDLDKLSELNKPTTKKDLEVREFERIEVTYPPEDICVYPEYKGKPYFGIQYRENGESIVGYGTYSPQVLSRYLKDYFMSTTKNNFEIDCISRADAIRVASGYCHPSNVAKELAKLPSVTPQETRWIPVGEDLPKDIKPVQITWKNNEPETYYRDIKGKHFTGVALYKDGKWYWYSDVTEDLLAEYGKCDIYELDSAIEVVAWMPMAEPYEESEEEG